MALDASGLRDLITERLSGGAIVVVSNREPYVHSRAGAEITWSAPASGLVTALESVMRATGGTWVAHGSGDADRDVVDAGSRVLVPPGERRYCLKRVWISKAEEEAYYYGFANQALWPLCHLVYTRPRFDPEQWRVYREVNRKFAQAVLEELDSRPTWVFVQDYHFALLPRMLKEARPDLTVAQFWHIPWPSPEVFDICPWAGEILDGLLGNDLLGFHTRQHCDNFQGSVELSLRARGDGQRRAAEGRRHHTIVRPFPISVDYDELTRAAECPAVLSAAGRLREELGLAGQRVAVGVDRVDYTKGIAERFLAVDRFLTKHPTYRGRFVLLQVGPLSRILIDEYRQLNDELYRLMNLINRRHSEDSWTPIRLLKSNYPRDVVLAFFRIADICLVSSLHDGMNLVAKEFVSARRDGGAALLLSRFAGAATELTDAILVNPYDTEAFADAIEIGLELPLAEKRRRMSRMRRAVARNNIYDWAASIVTEVGRLQRCN
jgi:alpha,alpha-trehalose-phosphate synthase [UDP-forming]